MGMVLDVVSPYGIAGVAETCPRVRPCKSMREGARFAATTVFEARFGSDAEMQMVVRSFVNETSKRQSHLLYALYVLRNLCRAPDVTSAAATHSCTSAVKVDT